MIRFTLPIALVLLTGCPTHDEHRAPRTRQEAAAPAVHQGIRSFGSGDTEKAIDYYSLAIVLNPHNALVYLLRAEARFVNGDTDGALADYNKTLQAFPSLGEAYRGRANVHVVLADFEAAFADLDKAIQLDPADTLAHRVRGNLHRTMGDEANAKADFAKSSNVAGQADQLAGKVVAVANGDILTIRLDDEKLATIRVYGIDCPERGQPFGTKAKQFTADRAFGKSISVKVVDTDRYGRMVGRVELPGGDDLSELLVQNGMAWHYVKYAPDDEQLALLEAAARQGKIGLWSDSQTPIPPWEWRKGERGETEPADSTGYWLSTGTGVRHNSTCKNYRATKNGRECRADEGKACGICGG